MVSGLWRPDDWRRELHEPAALLSRAFCRRGIRRAIAAGTNSGICRCAVVQGRFLLHREVRAGAVRRALKTFSRDQRQPLPPPNDFPVLFAQAKQFARRLGGGANQIQNLASVFWWGRSGFEIPVQVRLLE